MSWKRANFLNKRNIIYTKRDGAFIDVLLTLLVLSIITIDIPELRQNRAEIGSMPAAWPNSDLGWGLLSLFSPFRYIPHFPLLSKQTLAIEYLVYISQVSPQLSCGDTCQIWMWFRESSGYFCKIENFAYGEISERSFSNPHPTFSAQWYD